MPDIFRKFNHIKALHDSIVEEAGSDPLAVRIEEISAGARAKIRGRDCVLMGSNNYLGLTFDGDAIEAACAATQACGTGTTGSRAANGSYAGHQDLENVIAEFYGRDKAVLFTTGYQANVGFISAIAGKDDYILIDSESHASIYDGCNLSHATILHFRHNDAEDLAKRLRRLPEDACKLVITEGIFSMRGDRAPLKDIAAAAKQYGAYLMVDEAHSLGVLGANGRGLAEEQGVEDQVDFILGTFSKSVGTIGGFCVSNHPELDMIRLAARAYLFTASLPPSVVASAAQTLGRIQNEPGLRKALWENTDIIYDGLKTLGFDIGPDKSPVIGIYMPSLPEGLRAWNSLLENGVYVNLALPPATPEGVCLLRCSVSAGHTKAQLEAVLEAFAALYDELYPSAKKLAAE
ncbi:MAG: aminotransferase class I/II-fold pyridoxal phosphate-dependent enzyme [Alphaproteobacteria bacterium]